MVKKNFVKDATNWQKMKGSSTKVKKVNSFLTSHFVFRHDVPDDECHMEAVDICVQYDEKECTEDWLDDYLHQQFGVSNTIVDRTYIKEARQIIDILKN